MATGEPQRGATRLAVVADDFGLCAAVNQGVVDGFARGVVTDAAILAVADAFAEASASARRLGLPIGLHAAFTCEWERRRWRPLTRLASMTDPHGALQPDVATAWRSAEPKEAIAELHAQLARVRAAGHEPTHLSEHMGPDPEAKIAAVIAAASAASHLPHRGDWERFGRLASPSCRRYDLRSSFRVSSFALRFEKTKTELRKRLIALPPGDHVWIVHPAIDGPSLDTLCDPGSPLAPWARTYRLIDHALVTDDDVRRTIERREIRLTPIAELEIADP